jgi:hypothetical protein
VNVHSPRGLRGRGTALKDRDAERSVLDRLINAVRAGESRVLVVHGEPGIGKTVLLEYLLRQAAGCRVARAAGVQSEMELAFAGLHQLLAPMLNHVGALPAPQRDALRVAFGISAGPAPDRFLVGLAALGLLSEAAGERPLICLVDDAQWLDRASAQVLGFAARRLAADPVGVVFAARVPGEELAGLPELTVDGLPREDARALLDSTLTGSLDARVRDQILAETRGNPLALMLAAFRGREAEAAPLIQSTVEGPTAEGAGSRGDLRGLDGRYPLQRPGPVFRRAGGGPASQRAPARLCLFVGLAGADRGRRAHRELPHRQRWPGPAGRSDTDRRNRPGAGDGGSVARW